MANLGTIDLTRKDNAETRAIKRFMNELSSIYQSMGIVPENIQMIISKLRQEFDKEKDKLIKSQAAELKPIQVEFDKLTEQVRSYHSQLRELGKEHKTNDQRLAIKYMEIELKILKDHLKLNGKR